MEAAAEYDKNVKKFAKYLLTFGDPLYSLMNKGMTFSGLCSINIRGTTAYRFTDDDVKIVLAGVIDSFIPLSHIILTYHNISDFGAKDIGVFLSNKLAKVSHLNLRGNNITQPGLLFLNQCLLEYLDLSYNPLGEAGGMEVADFSAYNKSLQNLYLNGCNLNLKATIAVITSLNDNSNLEVLELDRPLLNYSRQEEVSDHINRVILAKNSHLTELSLRNHGILDIGACLLADALSRNMMLKKINLENNRICVRGAEALASFLILQHRQKLQYGNQRNFVESLYLSHNIIGDEGAIALAEVIQCSTSLKHLSIRDNRVGRSGLVALAEALASSSNSLLSISVFGNEFEQQSGEMFYQLIEERLPYLDMSIDIKVYIVDGIYKISDTAV